MRAIILPAFVLLGGAMPGALVAGVQLIPAPSSMRWLGDTLVQADSVMFFEGLPRQENGREVFAAEVKRVPTLVIDEEYFYARPVPISLEDQAAIGEMLTSDWFMKPPTTAGSPTKFCGGFHADYGVRWAKEEKLIAYLLICFGCGEVRFLHGDDRIETDMTPRGESSLRKILLSYRHERPPYRRPNRDAQLKALLPPAPKIQLKP